ncbi:hypothetical protein BHYA_0437g00030 [Botrytis hyacinthi]|uniref:Uncharacterized protein n=1 Tax=Botrytis hyacinthi TaxID=278943 RepID=A0A4Z1G8D1_9HELO|nr:hypothetical protein BHYA_0437g00030 [Botrytis hyacinthi]
MSCLASMSFNMDPSGDIQLPDMNISGNLEFYRKVIDFENDTGKHESIFGILDRSQQRAVQSIARSRNLDYEYQKGYAKVLRNCSTDWNFEDMIESSPAELTHYNESTDSGRLLNEPSHSEIDYFGSNLEIEPWPQHSVYPYPLELTSGLAQDNIASEGLPLPQPETGSQSDMPEYDIYGNSSALNGNGIDYNTHVNEEVTLAKNLNTPRISSDNSGYDPIQQNIRRNIQRQAYHQREVHAKTLHKSAGISRPSPDVPKPPSHASSTWSDNYNLGAPLTDEPFLMGPLYNPTNHSSWRDSRSNSFNSSTSLSPIPPSGLNPLNSPLNRFEMQALQKFASGSRSGSVSSFRSEHGRNRIAQTSRNSSVSGHNSLKSQTMDVTHDSPSRYASSGGSGRSGPLTSFARIGMKAIKMIGGASWRCRILGKKKGILAILAQNETKLAKQLGRKLDVIGPFTLDLKNDYVEEAARRRKKDIVSFTEGEDTTTELSLAIAALRQNMSLENFGRPSRPLSLAGTYFPNQSSIPSLIALDQCTMPIVWEIVEDSSHLQSLPTFCNSSERPLDDLVILLRSASIYQAKLEPDPHQLIAQSLICLREALELKRVKTLGALLEFSHRKCRIFEDVDLTDLVIDNIPFEKTSEDMMALMLDIGFPVPCAFNYQFDKGLSRSERLPILSTTGRSNSKITYRD